MPRPGPFYRLTRVHRIASVRRTREYNVRQGTPYASRRTRNARRGEPVTTHTEARTGADAIWAEGLTKTFKKTRALRGVDLRVRSGTVTALLGRNGAGKTTALRILTTLLLPDTGRAEVAGFDVIRDPQRVRARIGVTGQSATMDELLTGRQNLETVGPAVPPAARAGPPPGRRAAGTVRDDRRRRAPGADLFRGDAPPPGPGRQPGRRAARAVPGRADHRARPGQPGCGVPGDPRPDPGGGHLGPAHDPVPGRGRPAGR